VAAVTKKAAVSAKRVAANKKYAAAGRAAQKARTLAYQKAHGGKKPPRTKKQIAAANKYAAAGRAAQKARRAGKTPVQAKTAKAPANSQLGWDLDLHLLPVCGPVALAEHLIMQFPWADITDQDIADLARYAGTVTLANLFEAAAEHGLGGYVLDTWTRCDEELAASGMVAGLDTGNGYHAALIDPAGILSWGMVLPWPSRPAEAWHLGWRPDERAVRGR